MTDRPEEGLTADAKVRRQATEIQRMREKIDGQRKEIRRLEKRERHLQGQVTRLSGQTNYCARLREALEGLVKINEDHNAACAKIIGKHPDWKDTYLDAARQALKQETSDASE